MPVRGQWIVTPGRARRCRDSRAAGLRPTLAMIPDSPGLVNVPATTDRRLAPGRSVAGPPCPPETAATAPRSSGFIESSGEPSGVAAAPAEEARRPPCDDRVRGEARIPGGSFRRPGAVQPAAPGPVEDAHRVA